jgi:excisionase family DNA binding protein
MTLVNAQSALVRDVMTIDELAEYLKISPDTAYKYATTKYLPGFKLGGRWRFSRIAIDAWVNKQSESN